MTMFDNGLLSEKDLTLKKAEEIGRASEKAVEGMQAYKGLTSTEEVNYITGKNFRQPYRQGQNRTFNGSINRNNQGTQRRPNNNSSNVNCKYCLRSHPFGRDFCIAWGKRCNSCHNLNHFAKSEICSKQQVKEINLEDEGVNSLFLGAIKEEYQVNAVNSELWELDMPVKRGKITFKVDTGADVTVININDLELFGLKTQDVRRTRKRLSGPSAERLQCIGYITTNLSWGDRESNEVVYVCKNLKSALLGKPAIKNLKIVTMNDQNQLYCDTLNAEQSVNEGADIIREFPNVFNGLGCIIGDAIQIELEDNAIPYHLSAPRHVALPLLEPLKKELQRMVDLGVIREVDEPTEWCHPIVLAKKSDGSMRFCIDLTKLNTSTKREFYQLESVDETLAKIGKSCRVMTKLDANSGYWQIPLAEDSQLKATFITPFGRFRPTRGPFGLTSMQEIFNKRLDKIIDGLPGVVKSTDDFLVVGEDVQMHDKHLRALLTKLADNGVTLNTQKCKFRCSEIDFLGHHISAKGIQPIGSKIEAIQNYSTPTNITELRRFFGMAQQLSKFSPDLARASEPLRDLLSTKNLWVWTPVHAQAFKNTKKVLSSQPTLAHYCVTKPTKIRTDGSKLNGISVILFQEDETRGWKELP